MEICLNNTWGLLCGEGWKNSEASVVCQQLGFSQYGKLHLATLCSIGINCKIIFGIQLSREVCAMLQLYSQLCST